MDAARQHIITQLQKDILPLEGYKKTCTDKRLLTGIPSLDASFPLGCIPTGCIHELSCPAEEDIAAMHAFTAVLLSRLMDRGGVCIWVSASRAVYPSALLQYGIRPEQVIFIDLQRSKDVFYVMEEALKCSPVAAVIAELSDIDFKSSRRLQLATEHSRVTGFVLRHQPKLQNTIACMARWQVQSLASNTPDGMPGLGFARWSVDLLKVRNGHSGNWVLEWQAGKLKEVRKAFTVHTGELQRKTG